MLLKNNQFQFQESPKDHSKGQRMRDLTHAGGKISHLPSRTLPLPVLGDGKMLLTGVRLFVEAEKPTLPYLKTCKERYDVWLLQKCGSPWVYWNVALKGRTVPFLGAVTPPVLSATEAVDKP